LYETADRRNIEPAEYAWDQLPKDSLVVDVGGGVGAQSLTLALRHSHLRFVVQDRDSVVGDAVEVCSLHDPHHHMFIDNILVTVLEEEPAQRTRSWPREASRFVDDIHPPSLGCATLTLDYYQVQNFFEPQTAKQDVSVFLVSKVLHDWADEYCITILTHLRAAAGPKTQLVIIDQLIACACDEPATREIPGAELPVPPKPLLHNLGRAASTTYNFDLLVRNEVISNDDDRADVNLFYARAKDDGHTQWQRTHCYLFP